MEQIKSYLSLQESVGKVLIVGDEQWEDTLARYLQRSGKAAGICRLTQQERENLRNAAAQQSTAAGQELLTQQNLPVWQDLWARQNLLTLQNLAAERQIESIVFGPGWVEGLKCLTDIRLRYLIGQIGQGEDYFGLWESFSVQAEHICIVRERPCVQGRDAEHREVLEWNRRETPVELSVIIPVYNVRPYLEQCIRSLTAWQAPYVEYLFVDDGSTDGCDGLLEAWAAQDGRIRHIRKENGGCASARNLGLESAVGNYVGFVDGDDFVDKEMFRRLLQRAMMGRYEMAYCGFSEYHEEEQRTVAVRGECMQEPYLSGTRAAEDVQRLVIRTKVAIWRCLYRREFLLREGIVFHEELKRFDDLPFKVESGFLAKSVVCVPEHLYYYRIGRPGQDVACTDERLFVHFDIFALLDARIMPMKNRRLLDYLQIVKLHTHGYALSRIDRKYYRAYLRKARVQLDRSAGFLRTLCLMLVYGGRGNMGWYFLSSFMKRGKAKVSTGPENTKS